MNIKKILGKIENGKIVKIMGKIKESEVYALERALNEKYNVDIFLNYNESDGFVYIESPNRTFLKYKDKNLIKDL